MVNKTLINRAHILLISCLLPLLISSCNSVNSHTSSAIAPAPNLIRVGVSPNAPPLIYLKNGKITGLEADFAKRLGVFSGKTVKFIQMPWENQIQALKDNKIDIIMSGMSITNARQYQIGFTAPYLRSGQILLVRLGEERKFSTGIYSLMNSNYTIGVIKDTTGDLFITKSLNDVKVKEFNKSADAVKALLRKDIDAFVYDAPMVCYYAYTNENNKLAPILTLATEEYIAWGIRKEDTELLNLANAFLDDLKNKKQLQRIIRTWVPYL